MLTVQPTKRGERIRAAMAKGVALRSTWLLHGYVAHQVTPEAVAEAMEPPACECGAVDTLWEPAYVRCVCEMETPSREDVARWIASDLARARWDL